MISRVQPINEESLAFLTLSIFFIKQGWSGRRRLTPHRRDDPSDQTSTTVDDGRMFGSGLRRKSRQCSQVCLFTKGSCIFIKWISSKEISLRLSWILLYSIRVATSGLEVFAHNIETVERLTPFVRDPKAKYRQTLKVLKYAKEVKDGLVTKSSIMLGLGKNQRLKFWGHLWSHFEWWFGLVLTGCSHMTFIKSSGAPERKSVFYKTIILQLSNIYFL